MERSPDASGTIAVVGSMNMDFVVRVARLPGPGETVSGEDVFRNPGGKGANQAVAAARLGRSVEMVACVGEDDPGRALVAALGADGVGVDHVRVDGEVPTGAAFIAVDGDGENQIVVSAGTNRLLSALDVERATPLLRGAAVTLLQLEVPLETVGAAVDVAGGLVVLNPAPAREVPASLLSHVDVLVPNRGELAQLAGGRPPTSPEEAARLAASLPARAVVVTLGAEGALLVEEGRTVAIPAIPVRAVDTTAAGDAFCGALADALVRSEPLEAASRWAARVAAVACTRPGAQASLPTREEVLARR
ncbi:MAG: ribokinase [Actinomycetota bacterium]